MHAIWSPAPKGLSGTFLDAFTRASDVGVIAGAFVLMPGREAYTADNLEAWQFPLRDALEGLENWMNDNESILRGS